MSGVLERSIDRVATPLLSPSDRHRPAIFAPADSGRVISEQVIMPGFPEWSEQRGKPCPVHNLISLIPGH